MSFTFYIFKSSLFLKTHDSKKYFNATYNFFNFMLYAYSK